MPERIYTSAPSGKLEALEETPFSTADELQTLIAEHPELLDGEQIRPGDARRWLFITREKAIAPSFTDGSQNPGRGAPRTARAGHPVRP